MTVILEVFKFMTTLPFINVVTSSNIKMNDNSSVGKIQRCLCVQTLCAHVCVCILQCR